MSVKFKYLITCHYRRFEGDAWKLYQGVFSSQEAFDRKFRNYDVKNIKTEDLEF